MVAIKLRGTCYRSW